MLDFDLLQAEVFDSEIILAIWLTRALEDPGCPRRLPVDNRIVVEYLRLRTISDHTHRHGLTTVIDDAIESVTRMAPEALATGDNLVREACRAILQANRPAWLTAFVSVPNMLSKLVPMGCKSAENSLAFAAHLGLTSVVRRLLEDGVQDTRSDFGYASHCVVQHRDSQLASVFLQTKLDLSIRQANGNTSDCFLVHEKFQCTAQNGRRGISIHHYESLICHATAFGVLETVERLIDALCDDEGAFERCNCWFFLSKSVSSNPNTQVDLRTTALNLTLVIAAFFGDFDKAQAALNNGASASCSGEGWNMRQMRQSALSCAARGAHEQLFQLLVRHGADLWFRAKDPLLTSATLGGSLEIVEFCLRSGMTKFSRSKTKFKQLAGIHPITGALLHKRFEDVHEILRVLWKYGVTFEPESELDRTLCETATKRGDIGSLAILEEIREEQRALASSEAH